MTIDARTRLYGIVGYPIRHTLSPAMQNAAFAAVGWNAVYLAIEVPPPRLKQAVEGIRVLGIQGLNVTIPHKEAIIPLLDQTTQDVKLIGAVNTVVRERNGRLLGYNTDASGFLASLRAHVKWDPKGKSVALLGAGGSAKAVGVALARAGIRSLVVCSRTRVKADEFAKQLKARFSHVRVRVVDQPAQLGLEQCDLLVNATPVGMQPGDPLLVEPRHLHNRLIVYDLIYHPPETRLVREARQRRCQAFNGLDLLIRQGVESLRLWTHTHQDVEPAMRRSLEAALGEPVPKEELELAEPVAQARPASRAPGRPQHEAQPRSPRAGAPPRPARPKGGGDEIDITTQAGRLKLMELSYGHEAPPERKSPPQPKRRPPR